MDGARVVRLSEQTVAAELWPKESAPHTQPRSAQRRRETRRGHAPSAQQHKHAPARHAMHPPLDPLSCCCLKTPRQTLVSAPATYRLLCIRHVHVDGLRGRLGLIGLATVPGLAVRLLVAAIGLLWLLRVVTALTRWGTCHETSAGQRAAEERV